MKFMFFKWGHYFVGTEEFNKFSDWQVPEKLSSLPEQLKFVKHFNSLFYIWDHSLIWTLVGEVENFYRMYVITEEEKNLIKQELKDVLYNLENYLKGNFVLTSPMPANTKFYVSTMNMGFTCHFYESKNQNQVVFHTNFSFSHIEDCPESLRKIKSWIKSLRNVSSLLSESGVIERRLFFERQYKIIEQVLK